MNKEQSDPAHPQEGERLTVTIERLASGGDGVAHPGGFTLFVPHSAPGDVADVEVTKISPRYGRAKIVELKQPGPDRVATECPLAQGCPGCQLEHLSYDAQLEAKRSFVQDALERIGRVKNVEVRPTVGMTLPWNYRNKGEFVARRVGDQLRLGYHADENGGFQPLTGCPIQHPISMDILRATEEVANALELPLGQLITRVDPDGHHALAILVCWEWSDQLPKAAEELADRVPELVGVLWSQVRGKSLVRRTLAESLWGETALTQRLGKWEYTVSAESFFQVNNEQGGRLVRFAEEFAGDVSGMTLADGYCGVGTFLIPLAQRAERAIGVDDHPIALKDAEQNLARYHIGNTRIYEGRMETIFPRLLRKGRSAEVAVLDPPRKGAGRVVLESMAGLGVKRAIMISCDPATFGRDAADLVALGYRLEVVQPIDMFPQTWHVETIALAVKEE